MYTYIRISNYLYLFLHTPIYTTIYIYIYTTIYIYNTLLPPPSHTTTLIYILHSYISIGIRKDKYFASQFSKKKAPNMPMASWGLFLCRDFLTIVAGFNLPNMTSNYILNSIKTEMNGNNGNSSSENGKNSHSISSIGSSNNNSNNNSSGDQNTYTQHNHTPNHILNKNNSTNTSATNTTNNTTNTATNTSVLIGYQQYIPLACQLLVPMAIQIVVTPTHLLALDLYNRLNKTISNRINRLNVIYIEAASLRMVRVLCAYGIAGVANTNMKQYLRDVYI